MSGRVEHRFRLGRLNDSGHEVAFPVDLSMNVD